MTQPRRIWVLGGTSAIGHAYARLRAEAGSAILLLGRNEDRLRANAADLAARGAAAAEIAVIDFVMADPSETVATLAPTHGAPDEVLIAYGTLGDQAVAGADAAIARREIDTNFTSVVGWTVALTSAWGRSRPLTLAVIGSVAGDRGRRSNFVYGAAKGGLDRFLEGLAHASVGTPLRIVRIKPGFVDTPMTAAIPKGGPLWAKPDAVAADIVRAIDRGRSVLYTPWFWRPIMLVIRSLPRAIFNRLKI